MWMHGCLVLHWNFSPTQPTQPLAPILLVNGSLVRLWFITFPCQGPCLLTLLLLCARMPCVPVLEKNRHV